MVRERPAVRQPKTERGPDSQLDLLRRGHPHRPQAQRFPVHGALDPVQQITGDLLEHPNRHLAGALHELKWSPPMFYVRFFADPVANLNLVIVPAILQGRGFRVSS